MRGVSGYIGRRVVLTVILVWLVSLVNASDPVWPDRKLTIKGERGTRYELLRTITAQTGLLFVYDGELFRNDEEVRIKRGTYSLEELIFRITGDSGITIEQMGQHILLSREGHGSLVKQQEELPVEKTKHYTVSGVVFDRLTKEPLPYANIMINNTTLGNVTNNSGEFKLLIPDSLLNSGIRLSYLGYESIESPIFHLLDKQVEFALEPHVIPLQAVVVRPVNPLEILDKYRRNRNLNYASRSVYLTTFYREGVEHKRQNVDFTESVLKVYKPGYVKEWADDQVKLEKMRRVYSRQEADTLFARLKSGIYSTLMLDIVKKAPDFLATPQDYDFTHTDITVMDERGINVISFVQKEHVNEPLFTGELFFDMDNYALVEARFRMNPEYMEKATPLFVEKVSRNYRMKLRSAAYTVSYRQADDGIYYLNHIRGELEFRMTRRKKMWGSTVKVWFETATCMIEHEEVKPFPREERLSPRIIFSDTDHPYDEDFWKEFTIILPEHDLREFIRNNLGKIID